MHRVDNNRPAPLRYGHFSGKSHQPPRRPVFDLKAFNFTLEPLGLHLLSFQENNSVVERLCEVQASHPCKRKQQTELFEIEEWEDKPWTLMYKAHINRDYDRGDYFVLEKDGKIVAGAGYYTYPDAIHQIGPKAFSVLMSRFYTVPDHRVQWLGSHIVSAQLQAMRTSQGVLTFNDINKPLYEKIARLQPLAKGEESVMWPQVWRHFTALGNLHINATDQWCVVTSKEKHNLP
jgi:GNAT superfamily N-acetyltransferase